MSNKMNTKTHASARPSATNSAIEKSTPISSTTLIQKNLPQHHLNPTTAATSADIASVTPTNAKEKWSSLKSNLSSAVSDWAELEKQPTQKTPEQEQLDKVRSLISNLKERLAEF